MPTQTIEANIWQAGADPDALLLGVTFVSDRVLLNSIHVAKPDTASASQVDRGVVLRAHAADGNWLLKTCAVTEKPVIEGSDVSMVNDVTSIASCTNYIAAVIETKELYDSIRPAHSRGRFCFNGDMAPDSITLAASSHISVAVSSDDNISLYLISLIASVS